MKTENTTKHPIKLYLLAYVSLIVSMVVMTAMIKWLRNDSSSNDNLKIEQLERTVERQELEIKLLREERDMIIFQNKY